MPSEVINHVDTLGRADSQPNLLTFFDHIGHTIGDAHDVGVSAPNGLPEDNVIPLDDDGMANLEPITTNDDFGHDKEVSVTNTSPDDSEVVELVPHDETGNFEPEILPTLKNQPNFATNDTEVEVQAQTPQEPVNPPETAGVDNEPGLRHSTHTQVKPL